MDSVKAAQQGDRDAFAHLVRQFGDMAYAVACNQLNDPYLAEDAVQESFAEAFVHLSRLRDPNAFPGWFKTIVTRQCSRIVRRNRESSLPYEFVSQLASDQPSPHELAEKREFRRMIHRSVSVLPYRLRAAVQLFYIHGYSLTEISAFLGTPVPALKKRLFDARRKLRSVIPVADFVSVFRELNEGGSKVLHIVNGDSVAETLKQGVVQGDILVWREIYSEGPVFAEQSNPDALAFRASRLEQTLGIPRDLFLSGCEAQERQLAGFRDYDEIVLWFEYDLFDQTMLCYLLDWFSRQSLGRTKLHLLCIGSFPGIENFRGLGQLSAGQLTSLSGTWNPVNHSELELGSRAWQAFTSPDPRPLAALLQEDCSALPYLKEAFRFHLSRYPSVHNGLGIVEQLLLEQLAGGIDRPFELFSRVGAKVNWFGMGDIQFWSILRSLAQGREALLRLEGVSDFRGFSGPPPEFGSSRLVLTETGRNVLEGALDRIAVQGIDCWLGGVHLHGGSPDWRWVPERQTIVRMEPGPE
ncbi:sigma-70 family RNA polymerase sigma factor [Paenibacillus sp. GCM10012303]|uniref:sigma-70 family RNA polymerase sigma factor n=1 Tax=Paenibacillus sp. GCM10012303 TaxID=3317340 RepID=UPI00360CDE76